MAHMDVVEAKAGDWKHAPFKFREKDGYYLGRGSNDNKAALTGILIALAESQARRVPADPRHHRAVTPATRKSAATAPGAPRPNGVA